MNNDMMIVMMSILTPITLSIGTFMYGLQLFEKHKYTTTLSLLLMINCIGVWIGIELLIAGFINKSTILLAVGLLLFYLGFLGKLSPNNSVSKVINNKRNNYGN